MIKFICSLFISKNYHIIMMIKKLSTFVLVIFVVSCSTNKLSYEYFSECEELHNTFSTISKCGLNKINESCINANDCHLTKDRFVNIIEQLNLMLTKKEISEDEAFFRYLNIINSFENDKQKMLNKMNTFRNDYNYISLDKPFNLNCNLRFLNVCM